MKSEHPVRPNAPGTRRRLAALLAAMALAAGPSEAGQASDSFNITIHYVPLAAGTCATLPDGSGKSQVTCRPAVVAGAGGASGNVGGSASSQEFRLPDSRMKFAGAVVQDAEESFQAWGEYSSRMVSSRGFEYLEMTVTW